MPWQGLSGTPRIVPLCRRQEDRLLPACTLPAATAPPEHAGAVPCQVSSRAVLRPREAAGVSRASLPARLSFLAIHHQLGVGQIGMTGTGWWGQEHKPGKYLLLRARLPVQLQSNLACSSPEGF